jgi:hypothetical protein
MVETWSGVAMAPARLVLLGLMLALVIAAFFAQRQVS